MARTLLSKIKNMPYDEVHPKIRTRMREIQLINKTHFFTYINNIKTKGIDSSMPEFTNGAYWLIWGRY